MKVTNAVFLGLIFFSVHALRSIDAMEDGRSPKALGQFLTECNTHFFCYVFAAAGDQPDEDWLITKKHYQFYNDPGHKVLLHEVSERLEEEDGSFEFIEPIMKMVHPYWILGLLPMVAKKRENKQGDIRQISPNKILRLFVRNNRMFSRFFARPELPEDQEKIFAGCARAVEILKQDGECPDLTNDTLPYWEFALRLKDHLKRFPGVCLEDIHFKLLNLLAPRCAEQMPFKPEDAPYLSTKEILQKLVRSENSCEIFRIMFFDNKFSFITEEDMASGLLYALDELPEDDATDHDKKRAVDLMVFFIEQLETNGRLRVLQQETLKEISSKLGLAFMKNKFPPALFSYVLPGFSEGLIKQLGEWHPAWTCPTFESRNYPTCGREVGVCLKEGHEEYKDYSFWFSDGLKSGLHRLFFRCRQHEVCYRLAYNSLLKAGKLSFAHVEDSRFVKTHEEFIVGLEEDTTLEASRENADALIAMFSPEWQACVEKHKKEILSQSRWRDDDCLGCASSSSASASSSFAGA